MAEYFFKPTPHTEAAALIKDKPVVVRDVFDKLLPELKGRAFTISGIEAAKVLQDVRDIIAELPEGGNWDDLKSRVADELSQTNPFVPNPDADDEEQAKARAAAEARAELLLRTHGFQAYAAANERIIQEQKDVFPFCEYITAGDDRVRDSHAALDGKIIPTNDPFWDTHTPPWDWGCRCLKVPRTADDVAEIRSEESSAQNPESRRVMEGAALRKLNEGHLISATGQAVNVAPREGEGAFKSSPGELRIPLDQLQGRYDADIWGEFEAWAKKQEIGDQPSAVSHQTAESGPVTVWDWLKGAEVVAAKPETTAQGKPVADALTVALSGTRATAVRTALDAVAEIHGDGDLPVIPVVPSQAKSYAAAYVRTAQSGKAIEIRVSTSSKLHETNFLHELGHFMDHQTLGDRGRYASDAKHPVMDAWRKAVENSAAVKSLRETLARGTIFIEGPGKTVEVKLSSSELANIRDYWLAPHELFARSYAQFIAEKSGRADLRTQLAGKIEAAQRWQQWTPEDFAPIMKEIQALFRMKGWIK
jgi:SPP1 gp7 family putative phage head morphogenesis protein